MAAAIVLVVSSYGVAGRSAFRARRRGRVSRDRAGARAAGARDGARSEHARRNSTTALSVSGGRGPHIAMTTPSTVPFDGRRAHDTERGGGDKKRMATGHRHRTLLKLAGHQ